MCSYEMSSHGPQTTGLDLFYSVDCPQLLVLPRSSLWVALTIRWQLLGGPALVGPGNSVVPLLSQAISS